MLDFCLRIKYLYSMNFLRGKLSLCRKCVHLGLPQFLFRMVLVLLHCNKPHLVIYRTMHLHLQGPITCSAMEDLLMSWQTVPLQPIKAFSMPIEMPPLLVQELMPHQAYYPHTTRKCKRNYHQDSDVHMYIPV